MNLSTPLTKPILTIEDALQYMESLQSFRIKLRLGCMNRVLDTLGNPQDAIPTIHIAGTNGKGSVTAMLSSVLKAAGYYVGTFTSPHLVHVRERICINGNPILPDDFVYEVNQLKAHLEALAWPEEEWPTYFEYLNAMFYCYCKRKNVELLVVETGVGGRLDSTNVVKHPILTVITSIGMDHMHILGDTLAKIAAEKAGIIKQDVPLVLNDHIPEEAKQVILSRADQCNALVQASHADEYVVEANSNPKEGLFVRNQQSNQIYRIPLLGLYQKYNLAVVLACIQQLRLQGYALPEDVIQQGLVHTYWPVRFQFFSKQNLILDGSHNSDGFTSLPDSLNLYFSDTAKVWLVSLRANREPQKLVELIRCAGETLGIVICQSSPQHLYHSPHQLAEIFRPGLGPDIPIVVAENPLQGLAELQGMQAKFKQQEPLGIITGSLYTAGEILRYLESNP